MSLMLSVRTLIMGKGGIGETTRECLLYRKSRSGKNL